MLSNFFRNYFEIPVKNKKVVCLGGGVGTSNILSGLRDMDVELTAIVSMADDGGSAGRLRRAFQVPPPGDLINCLAALSDEESIIKTLFLYRFAGKRYGKDTDLGGQKLGNLIFVALTDICKGDTNRALEELSKIISSTGRVLPATVGDVNIWAKTQKGTKVIGEENIDLGNYSDNSKSLSEVFLEPAGIRAYKPALEAIAESELIIVGPGDLFSTILPVLIVPQIKNALIKSKAKKIFVVNTTNKPFETANFSVSDYIAKLKSHIGRDIFDTIIINTNQRPKIPSNLKYEYVKYDGKKLGKYKKVIKSADIVDTKYPLYHDSAKVAKKIKEEL